VYKYFNRFFSLIFSLFLLINLNAFNNSDLILPNTPLSGGYTMTLGQENMSNSTGNVVLVRIALTSGQSISSLSITEASV